jgi:L-iditol 2-dehydrogenase
MGHEFSGRIVEVGKEVKGWSKGDRVVAEPHTKACGTCALCRSGNRRICPEKRGIGWGIDGAFTKYLKMPAVLLHRIPDNISYEEAAVTEPTAVAVEAVVLRGQVKPGDFVVVEGAGPIGLLSALAAKAGGASKVLITGIGRDARLRLPVAEQVGVDYVVNVEEDPDIVDKVRKLTGGMGADLVVEASGAPSAIWAGIEMVRRLGCIVVLGVTGKKRVSVPWDEAVFKGCDVLFSFSTTYASWEEALDCLANRQIDVRPLITLKSPLEDWQRIFEALEKGEGVKGLLIP